MIAKKNTAQKIQSVATRKKPDLRWLMCQKCVSVEFKVQYTEKPRARGKTYAAICVGCGDRRALR
jgi:hypothetical protein